MKKKVLLSIIIVNYKAANLISDCIKSIKRQKINCEIIIVDNNSGQHEKETLTTVRDNYEDVRLIFNEKNIGFSKANNQALALSSGQYILFLNPDTYIFDSCIQGLLSFYENSNNIGALTPKIWMNKEKTFIMPTADMPCIYNKIASSLFPVTYRSLWLKKALSFWNTSEPIEVKAISGSFILTKKEIMDLVGNFDEQFPLYYEDSDLCRRINKIGYKLFYYPLAEAVHYYNQSAKSSSDALNKFIMSEKLYMQKHFGPKLYSMASFLSNISYLRYNNSKKQEDFTLWDYTKPIDTSNGDYLLFSPLPQLIPCAAHKIKDKAFTFPKSFIEKLSKGPYYLAQIDNKGNILKRFSIHKNG
jgi:GT2 family glycosyltransferase